MKQNLCINLIWLFIAISIPAWARPLRTCDALSGFAQFGEDVSLIRKQIAPEANLQETLNEIHNSYSFFKFPIYDEGTPRLREVCPNFKVMNREDKEKFWRNFWSQLATYESSGEMKMGRGPDGDLCGYLQLPCELKLRKDKVKPEFLHECTGDVMSSALNAKVNNFRCGMAMLQKQVDVTHEIFPDKNKQKRVYWSPIRNPNLMYNKICGYQGCGNTPDVCKELLRKREQELK